MAKLIHLLAASVGGGLVLGASIRLGEAIGGSALKAEKRRLNSGSVRDEPAGFGDDRPNRSSEEAQASGARSAPFQAAPGWQAVLAQVTARIDDQQRDVEDIRRQMGNASRALDSAEATVESLRGDLHRQLRDDLDERLATMEEKLYMNMKASNRETVDAMIASIERRLAPRIGRLENEINGQSAAMAELRECSLQSERSVLKLLTVLERTMGAKTRETESELGQRRAGEQSVAGAGDLSKPDLAKLSVVTSRAPEELPGGGSASWRPMSVR